MNEWDLYVVMAVRYQWTPDEVDGLDPNFLDSLLAYQQAEAMNNKQQKGK